MADYISRDEAIEKITALINESGKYTAYESGADDACYIVEHQVSAADVVEVVRCKDCIHAGDRDCPIDWPKNGEDYCSYGERRADNG